ncbi:Methyltransferase FkbM family (plasmid) [Neorhizobium galegae bv. officinalis bv. officinalis str. HAMBI 1141]|uniref:Methyltransferase FkbM family n=1 Tax=Neorhizobium galegae bv. officinalis bv. officinalis str. HAMBI 1141 TaxID=1028801 RepID=A0A068TFQ4_NEOGA|nr:FkbM family methyltransferase [Neorhizobium galegae]CDN57297.1 Methyltransferase FkbM family [Neorhizobium galegae bv. officinalis bv. officinalis str. HAMBI 1141]
MSLFRRLNPKAQPKTKTHSIGSVEITLNEGHQLPKYEAKHPLYDRFLPVLASVLPDDGSWIVDVGANVGDTAVALYQNCKNPILSIEGDAEFYSLLQRNVQQLGGRVTPIQALVGTGSVTGDLVRDGTTATRKGDGQGSTVTLDNVLMQYTVEKVSLLKTDTDGFDADIIKSAPNLLKSCRPLLFWENDFQSKEQRDDLESGYDFLRDLGYSRVWIFDNFGFPILSDIDFSALTQINDYIHSTAAMGKPKTIFYTDVLAATPENEGLARKALAKYRELIPAA